MKKMNSAPDRTSIDMQTSSVVVVAFLHSSWAEIPVTCQEQTATSDLTFP